MSPPASWSDTPLAELSADAVALLFPIVEAVSVPTGETILREKSPADHVLFVRSGKLSIWRNDKSGTPRKLRAVDGPIALGIASLATGKARTATVRAESMVEAVSIPAAELRSLVGHHPAIADIVPGLISETIDLLDITIERAARDVAALEERARTHRQMGVLLVFTIIGLSAYSLALVGADGLERFMGSSDAFKAMVMLFVGGGMAAFARYTKLPSATFGLGMNTPGKQVVEGLLSVALLIPASVAAKAWFFPETPLIATLEPDFAFRGWMLFAVYMALVPLQEIIVRGLMQGSLQHFLTGKLRLPLAILGSNAVFLVAHLNMDVSIALLSAGGGLIWGVLYARHHSILGVTLSHWIVGAWVLFVMDFPGIWG